jgi:DNA modification methylase
MTERDHSDKAQSAPVSASPARPWPADRIELWPIERLIPYAKNPRLHTEADIAKIEASILRWGWTMPVLVDENGGLIVGDARFRAAARLKLPSVPVIVARDWTEEERCAYRLADNELAARASWDPDLLRDELQHLKFAGFDLDLIGFETDRLAELLRPNGLTDADSIPEVTDQPVTGRGDIWLLGDHRIGCGDSTSAGDVAPVLAGSQPHLMVTDPPYGVAYDPSWRARCGVGAGKLSQGKVLNDDRADWRQAYALFPGDVAYVWHGALRGDVVAAGLAACGLQLRAQIVWTKQHFTLGRGDYHWKHETCWYAVREGQASHWTGDRTQTTVWEVPNSNPFGNPQREQSWGHATQKPVECMRRPIVNNSRLGHAIYDPFLGAGTTLIAAEMTGRICYGLELNPAYVDVVVQRWQAFTGRAATHQASGQSFDQRAEGQGPTQSAVADG